MKVSVLFFTAFCFLGCGKDGVHKSDKGPNESSTAEDLLKKDENSQQKKSSPPSVELKLPDDLPSLKALAEGGNSEAQVKLGLAYAKGEGVGRDIKIASEWIHRAAEQGNAKGQFYLGSLYFNGDSTEFPGDIKKAIGLWKKSAEQGFAEAQFYLGERLYRGLGMPQDAKKALVWMQKAADQGFELARFALAAMYLEDRGIKPDIKKGLQLFNQLASEGNTGAQSVLGEIYYEGKVVEKDKVTAAAWFKISRFNKDLLSSEKYSKLMDGMTTEQVYAAQALARAMAAKTPKLLHQPPPKNLLSLEAMAAKGDAKAQFELGQLYGFGVDLLEDTKESMKWYHKSAEQGHVEAQYAIGAFYSRRVEDVTALAWYIIANTNRGRDPVDAIHLQRMEPQEIEKAKLLSREMIKKNPKLINE